MRYLRHNGLSVNTYDVNRKVAEGLTSPHEAALVIRSDVGSVAPCAAVLPETRMKPGISRAMAYKLVVMGFRGSRSLGFP